MLALEVDSRQIIEIGGKNMERYKKDTSWCESSEIAEVWSIMTGEKTWQGHHKEGVIVNCNCGRICSKGASA
jgi:hypothetical protein